MAVWYTRVLRLAEKALHSDSGHTLKGNPIYFDEVPTTIRISWNGIIPNCEAMLELVQVPADSKVSIYVDRAIAAEWF